MAINNSLVEQGHQVKFVAALALMQHLQLAKQNLKLQDALIKLDKYNLLIVDDVGYVRKTEQEKLSLADHRGDRSFSAPLNHNSL